MALGTFHRRGMGLPRTTRREIHSEFPRRVRATMAAIYAANPRRPLRSARILKITREEQELIPKRRRSHRHHSTH